MARAGVAVSGRTLGWVEGFAGLRSGDLAYKVRRAALTGLSIGALVAGVAATSTSWKGFADPRVDPGNPGEQVLEVGPTGFAWEAGIRTGQVVDVLVPADDAGGWRLETLDGAGRHVVLSSTADAALRASLPLGVTALAFGFLGAVFLRTRRRWVLPAAAIALLAASTPLRLEGSPELSTLVIASAALVPSASYALRLPGRSGGRALALGALLGLVIAWAAMRITGSEASLEVEWIRSQVATWATLILVLERVALPVMTGQPLRIIRPRLFDVVVVGGFVSAVLLLGIGLTLPPLATALILLAGFAIVPAARRQIGRPLEDVLLADVRQQAAAEAAESERASLARQLHDVPLQELAAVIRRLEILPGAEAESEDLRALAGHLRNVATELRPPVLDDLGLPAGLDYLAEEASTPALPVTAEVIDDTGFGTDRRPPTDVELALYRIAAEAVGNAVRHSGGSKVEIVARVAPDLVELIVRDDGAGLASGAARDAIKRKRLGLTSMRRRAEAVDAELSFEGSAGGTTVRAVWRA